MICISTLYLYLVLLLLYGINYSLSFIILKSSRYYNRINKVRLFNLKLPITNEIKDFVITDYNSGSNQYDIANNYNISQKTVSFIINKARENGVYVRTPQPIITSKILDNIIKDYNNGSKQSEIAKRYNTSHDTVSRYLMQARESGKYEYIRTPTRVTNEMIDNIVNDYNNGSSQYTIANKYNISQITVSKILTKARENGNYKYIRTPNIKSPNIITNEIIDNVVNDYNNDSSQLIDIANKHNISRASVIKIIRNARESNNYNNIRKTRIITNETLIYHIITDYNNGYKKIEVGNKYNITKSSVSYFLKKARKIGLYVRPQIKIIITNEIRDNVITEWNEGNKQIDIAITYNLSQSAVKYIIRKARKSGNRWIRSTNKIPFKKISDKVRNNIIIDYYTRGKKGTDIADYYYLSAANVYYILRRYRES